jgi:hypothetical protein
MKNFIYFCFLFIIIFVFAYINSLHTVEEFTPKIKEMYRPYIRNARIISEGFYTKTSNDISNIFRKIGIM